ncbi:MAG: cytidylate kinase family protein [Candidatus Aenigmatarchaeota archaeon]
MSFKKQEDYLKRKIYFRILYNLEKFNHKYVIFSPGIPIENIDSSNPLYYNLLHKGYACVTYEYEGFCRSKGKFSLYNSLESLRNVIKEILGGDKKLNEIILIGLSFGALLSLIAASDFKKVEKVIAISAPTRLKGLENHIKEKIKEMKRFSILRTNKNIFYKIDELEIKYNSKLEIKDILFIHGKLDELTPFSDIEDFAKKFILKPKIITLNSKHLGWWIFNNSKILRKTLEFIKFDNWKKILRKISERRDVSVVVSGPPLSGSSTVGRIIASFLDFDFFSLGEFYRKRSKGNIPIYQAMEITKKKSFYKIMKRIDYQVSKKCKKGGMVLDAKAGVYLTRNSKNIFKIYLVSDFKERVKRGSKKDKIPMNIFRKELKKQERLERELFKKLYGINYRIYQRRIANFVCRNKNLTHTIFRILKALSTWYESKRIS